jgi:prolyl-tRNA synthetase
MIGGMIMVHSDDDGLVLPPRVAPAHVVILPIFKKGEDRRTIMESAQSLKDALEEKQFHDRRVVVEIDDRDTGGARGWEWVKKGVPVRIELGPRDLEQNSVFMARRDTPSHQKNSMDREEFIHQITDILDNIQDTLFNRAQARRKENTIEMEDKKAFYKLFKKAGGYDNGAFVMAHWCGSDACEETIKKDLSVTIRCIPFDSPTEEGRCICCDQPSSRRVLFAKAY